MAKVMLKQTYWCPSVHIMEYCGRLLAWETTLLETPAIQFIVACLLYHIQGIISDKPFRIYKNNQSITIGFKHSFSFISNRTSSWEGTPKASPRSPRATHQAQPSQSPLWALRTKKVQTLLHLLRWWAKDAMFLATSQFCFRETVKLS